MSFTDSTWETPSARHPVNVGHLVMGVAFTGIALIWALNASGAVTGSGTRFLFPLPWVAAGVAGLIASMISKKHREQERRAEATRRAAWAEEQAQLADRWTTPAATPMSEPVVEETPEAGSGPATPGNVETRPMTLAPEAATSHDPNDPDTRKDDLR